MSVQSRSDVIDERALGDQLARVLPRSGAVSVSPFRRVVAAVDASHYLLTPRAVVTAASTDEIAAVLQHAREFGTPVTFRSGGASLSGQASTDGPLVDCRRHFDDIEVLDEGSRVRVDPGPRSVTST